MRLSVLTVTTVLALSGARVATAAQRALPRDVTATHAYLLALHDANVAIRDDRGAGEAEARRLISHVRSQCPDVLAGAPTAGPIFEEAVLDLALAWIAADRPAVESFAHTIEKLRWTNPALTRYVHRQGTAGTVWEDIAVPDICADAELFVADKFQGVPAETTRLFEQRTAAEEAELVDEPGHSSVQISTVIIRLIAPYERPDDRRLRPVGPTKSETAAHERAFVAKLNELLLALGLPQIGSQAESR